MSNETPVEELFTQMDSIRHAVRHSAEETLRKTTKKHRKELVEILQRPERHRHVRAILECLFQFPSRKLLEELTFLLDHPSNGVRYEYAEIVAKSGKSYTVPLIEEFLRDPNHLVRLGATNGLSDRAESSFSKAFARKVGPFLYRFICDYPDDNAPWRYHALEVYDPVLFQKYEAACEEGDSLHPIVREAFDVGEHFESHRMAVSGFETHPPGLKYIYATHYVDAEIRNGGISELHGNSAWVLMPDAIEGMNRFGCRKLSECLKEIVYYYHRKGRSKLKRRITDEYFSDLPPRWNKSLDVLEDQYYSSFRRLKTDNVSDLWDRALTKTPKLFERSDSGENE